MASLLLHSDRLEVKLTRAEKTLALRKDDIVIPRESIRSAMITDDPWIWVRGIRAPGTAIPLTLAVGQWKFHGGKDFLVLKGTKSSVVIDIIDGEFSRVIITTKHGTELVSKLQPELPEQKPARARKATPLATPKPKRAPKPKAAEIAIDAPGEAADAAVTGADASEKKLAKPAKKAPVAAKSAAVKSVKKAPAPSTRAKPEGADAADSVDAPVEDSAS